MLLAAAVGVVVALAGDGGGGKRTDASVRADASVTVNGAVAYQRIDGFGTSQRVFDDPHVFENFDPATRRAKTRVPPRERARIYDSLYRRLKLSRVRAGLEEGVEPKNDNRDPDRTNRRRFRFGWKLTDAYISYVAQAARRGRTVHWLSQGLLEPWMETSRGTPREYTERAMAVLRRWRARGYTPPYYSILNEPGYYQGRRTAWQGSGPYGFSGQYLRRVVRLLGPKLRREGFRTKLVVPDDINPFRAYERARVVLADRRARRYLGAIATHLYGAVQKSASEYAGLRRLVSLARRYRLRVWMTEYFTRDPFEWAQIMHRLLTTYRISAIDYLWGFFGQWQTNGSQLITLSYERSTGRYTGFRQNKQYYVLGQFSRFISPGARRIKATGSGRGLNVSAYRKGRRVTLVAQNTNLSRKVVRFRLRALPGVGRVSGVRTTEVENWARLSSIPVRGGSFTVTLPPRSIATFTN